MSELAKEKLYRNELIKAGATGKNNVARIRSLSGGGGGGSQALDDLLTGQLTILESNVSGTIIGNGFYMLQSISLPNATEIAMGAFSRLESLETINLPNVTTIGEGAFGGCTSLKTINLPNVTTIGEGAFGGCTSLKTINLPNVVTVGYGTFESCEALESISLPNVTTIGEGAFESCEALESITLGANQVCTIGTYAFDDIQNTITVYVPSNLIEQYKVATNWSTYYTNNRVNFVAITE